MRSTIISFAFLGLLMTTAGADDFHLFRLAKDEQPVQAKLESYDFVTRKLSLVGLDGAKFQVDIFTLVDSDRRFVMKSLQHQFNNRPESTRSKKESDSQTMRSVGLGNVPTDKSQPANQFRTPAPDGIGQNLWGIDWQSDFARAKKLAAGSAVPEDDKPILWFRVLGDLRGFM